MSRISYSQLSMFNNCQYQWKLSYIDKIPRPERNIHLIFGSAMHTALQKYLQVMYSESAKAADSLPLPELLKTEMIKEFTSAKEAMQEHLPDALPCTLEEINEFYNHGLAIIDYFKKHRGAYFQKRGYRLLGIELPLEIKLKENLNWVGFLDDVMYDEKLDRVKIIDIKTATKGWNKWMKADFNKTSQLLFYKKFYAEQYKIPIENIDIEFFIVKRTLYENVDFPQRRIQIFAPASGKVSVNKASRALDDFLNFAFDDQGNHRKDAQYIKEGTKKACRFCPFNQTQYCDSGVA